MASTTDNALTMPDAGMRLPPKRDVQGQRGRLEGGGRKAEKGQEGDVPGCPAVADAGVEDRHREDAGREAEE